MRKAELIDLLGLEYNKPQTVRELRAQAKKSGLRGYSRMRKAELITLLDNNKSVGDKPTVVDNNELEFVHTAGVGKYLRGWILMMLMMLSPSYRAKLTRSKMI